MQISNERIRVEYTPEEHHLLIKGMIEFRESLIRKNQPVDDINTIILKTIYSRNRNSRWRSNEREQTFCR